MTPEIKTEIINERWRTANIIAQAARVRDLFDTGFNDTFQTMANRMRGMEYNSELFFLMDTSDDGKAQFQCRKCGEKFDADAHTEENYKADERGKLVPQCPKCDKKEG